MMDNKRELLWPTCIRDNEHTVPFQNIVTSQSSTWPSTNSELDLDNKKFLSFSGGLHVHPIVWCVAESFWILHQNNE